MKRISVILVAFACARASALAPTGSGASLIESTKNVYEAEAGVRRATVQADALPTGSRSSNLDDESIRSYTVRSAYRWPSEWQAGGTLQLANRQRRGAGSTALSEFKLNVGYRAQRPAATTYAQVTVPVSRSAFETGDPYQLDALGRGFWAFGLGQHFAAGWGGYLTYEVHRSLPRAFANGENAGVLRPGFGASFGTGYTYQIDRFSVGGSLTWIYEDPVFTRGDRVAKNGSAQRFGAPGVNVGYAFGAWRVGLSYADQTILPAASAGLVREVGLTAGWAL